MSLLLVLTGPSHAGKSSVARELLERLERPAVHISIDAIVTESGLERLDEWEAQLPSAYGTALERVEAALGSATAVIFESTFTFVPLDDRPGQFHADQVAALERVAARCGARFALVRLTAELPELLRRRKQTGRLDESVVEGTWGLHRESYAGPEPLLEIATDSTDPAAAAGLVVAALGSVQAAAPTR